MPHISSVMLQFRGADLFNIDLCPWGRHLKGRAVDVVEIFYSADSCPYSSPPDLNVIPPGPLCHACTNVPTLAPSSTPAAPSSSTSPSIFRVCFGSRGEINTAIDAYVLDPSPTSEVSIKYGYPIGTWCVKHVTNFYRVSIVGCLIQSYHIASHRRQVHLSNKALTMLPFSLSYSFHFKIAWKKADFNHDISGWETSQVTDMNEMYVWRRCLRWYFMFCRFLFLILLGLASFSTPIGLARQLYLINHWPVGTHPKLLRCGTW